MTEFGSNLTKRVLTAAVALPTLLAALLLGSPALGVAIVAAAVLLAMREYLRLVETAGHRPFRITGWLLLVAFFLQGASAPGSGLFLGPVAVTLLLVALLPRSPDFAAALSAGGATLLGAAYLGVLGGSMAALRVIEPGESGAWRLVLLMAIVMVGDTAAYFVGHAWGRRRLAPSLSPGKTVEGALGGLLGGALGALAIRHIGLPGLPWGHAVVLGVVVSALGIAGDLVESLFKRWAGVKDSGALLPGHGGMLDRIDSLLFGAPALYYYFLYVR